MNKADVSRMLQKAVPGKAFLNVAEISRALGMGKDHTRTVLAELDYLPSGREKRYLLSDVAEKIADMRVAR